jgi:hypothetical protein
LSLKAQNLLKACRIYPVLLLALLPLATSGCVSMGTFTTALDGWVPSGGRRLVEDEPRIFVELRPSVGSRVRKAYPIDRDLVVQDALDLARASSKFAKMNVYVYRQDPSGRKVKFGADYDVAKRRVKYESDYALHPGDTIVVEEDASNALTETLDRISGNSMSRTR